MVGRMTKLFKGYKVKDVEEGHDRARPEVTRHIEEEEGILH